jgi:hypothetical protein
MSAPFKSKDGRGVQGVRIHTHPDGITRVGAFAYEGKTVAGVIGSLVPAGCTSFYEGPAVGVLLRRFPPKFTTGYHNDPPKQHQLVFHLEGEAGGDCKDGSSFRLKPGEFASVEDPVGTGHTAYDAGDAGFTQIFVSVPSQ